MELEHKVAIVTGGASGIGAAVTRSFVGRGARIVVVDVQQDAGEKIARENEGLVCFLYGDVSEKATADAAVNTAVSEFGRLDAVVNNAHASRQTTFMDHTQEIWDLSFNTGFKATVNFMRSAYTELAKTQGSVINFGSGAGLNGQPTQAAYAAAKETIRGVSRVVANE